MFSFQKNALFINLFIFIIIAGPGEPGFSKSKTGMQKPAIVGDVIPNKIVVKFKDARNLGKSATVTGSATLDGLLQKYNATQLDQVVSPYENLRRGNSSVEIERIYYVHFSDGSPVEMAAEMSQDPMVEYAEPLHYHELYVTPNDTLLNQQSYLNVIQARNAWDIVKGENGDVVIAVIDGGTDIDHPDLQANIWTNPDEVPGNGIDDDNNGFIDDVNGWNFANDSNDPSGLFTTPNSGTHGTNTAGIACAVTNNITGVAGASWNAKLLPINAASPNIDRTIEFGYEGILYAANSGADVINLSWGGGTRSEFGEDIVNFASDMGAAIVASAGNLGNEAPVFPAAYRNVLSVAATNNSDIKAGFSNFGRTIDIAAPGVSIFNTLNDNNYGALLPGGTSFSSPMVAAVIGLVKTQRPGLTGKQAAQQVRATADNIDLENPNYVELLGKGRLNAFRAVTETSPAIRITEVQFQDASGDGVIKPGESVQISLTLQNFLESASNINLILNENDPFVTLTNNTANISSLGVMQEMTLTSAFGFVTAINAPSGHPVEFTLDINAGSYSDFDSFVLTILPTFGTADVNDIRVTVTNIGRIGFSDPLNRNGGIGFRFQEGPNLLYEGAVITGIGPTRISSAARGVGQSFDQDFEVAESGDLRVEMPGAISDQQSIGIFEDTQAGFPMNIRITQETFAESEAPNNDFVLFKYAIENLAQTVRENFHFGLYFDWDIDDQNFITNVAEYDPARRLGYCYDSLGGPDTYVGMSLLSEGGVHYRAIYNDDAHPSNPAWGLYDGFSDAEKWESISSGIQFTSAGPEDVSFVIATGPLSIPPNEIIEVGFALVGGVDLQDLQNNADAARTHWEELFVTSVEEPPVLPTQFALQQNFPNPFNPTTTIRYDLPEKSDVELSVYNLLGQKIRTLVQTQQNAGFHSVEWNGRNEQGRKVASGVYIYHISAAQFVETKKMILLQ